ncbi:hypothetical protein HPB51_029627 [Rhipicephalus microplus]|uniref:Uncharacterized protein n=1 Tax=Rhipicephalus microplus TaxID=6941 RepID=A0A9J6CTM1_RHIMP|nr:hypothetical protein HPB51_029627 [Rhipicephalus microplus]
MNLRPEVASAMKVRAKTEECAYRLSAAPDGEASSSDGGQVGTRRRVARPRVTVPAEGARALSDDDPAGGKQRRGGGGNERRFRRLQRPCVLALRVGASASMSDGECAPRPQTALPPRCLACPAKPGTHDSSGRAAVVVLLRASSPTSPPPAQRTVNQD